MEPAAQAAAKRTYRNIFGFGSKIAITAGETTALMLLNEPLPFG
jgi:hypothetical protein